MNKIANLLNLAASQLEGTEIPQDEVVIGTAGLESVLVLDELRGQCLGIGNDLLGVGLEFGLGSEVEGCRDGCDGL